MQPHPDRGELKLYLRGYAPAPVANVIKQHLMICDQCVSDALVEYDQLDRARAAVPAPVDSRNRVEVTSVVPAARTTIVIDRPEPRLRYAWAALLPIATAVGLIWTAYGREDKLQYLARVRTAPVVDQFRFSNLAPPPSDSLETRPVMPAPAEAAAGPAEPTKPRPVKRRRLAEDSDSLQAAQKTPVARFYVVSAKSTAGQPLLLQPIEVQAPAVKSENLHSSAALSLVTRGPSFAPPPQRNSGLKRVFSVLAAPFRKS